MLSIHLPSEPAFVSNTIPLKKHIIAYVKVNHVQYIVDEGNPDLSYDNCFQQCLVKQIKMYMGCDLSTTGEQSNQCNTIFNYTSGTYPYYLATDFMDIETISKIMNASKWFQNLKELSEDSEWIDEYEEIKEMCIKSCSISGNHNFLHISEYDESEFGYTYVTVNFNIDNYHSVEIDDWLKFSQLLGNLGGIISCTVGLSMYSLLNYLIVNLFKVIILCGNFFMKKI